MSRDDRLLRPHEMADMGLIDSLSMRDFSPDQRLVAEALNVNAPLQQQGGGCVRQSNVPSGTAQPGIGGSPLPNGFPTRSPGL